MKKSFFFIVVLFFLNIDKVFALSETDLEAACDYAVASSIYWECPDQSVVDLLKKNLGKKINARSYVRIESETGLPEYFIVFPKLSFSNYVVAIHVWPQSKSKYSFELVSEQPLVNEFKNVDVKDLPVTFSENWEKLASQTDEEGKFIIPKLKKIFEIEFKRDGKSGAQVIYVGPFTKWSNGIYVYLANEKKLIQINTAWVYMFNSDFGLFDQYSKILWNGENHKRESLLVKRCIKSGVELKVHN